MVPALARASASSAGENSARKRQMGTSLSLHQPGTHGCLHCSRRFSSMQAVGGHQNAHRAERLELEKRMLEKMREDEKRREIQEGKRIVECEPSPVITAAPEAANGGIDLELRLGIAPRNKPVSISWFMPVARVEGYGSGAHSGMSPAAQSQGLMIHGDPMALRAGGAGAGAGTGAGGGGGGGAAVGLIDQWVMRMLDSKRVDLNLKL